MLPAKVISGGQTGADQGALFAAKAAGIPTGGTAPPSYVTEVGPDFSLGARFGLIAAHDYGYDYRTERNVIDSDATLILSDRISAGSTLTLKLCKRHDKPVLMLRPDLFNTGEIVQFIRMNVKKNGVLNVAGNRESVSPGIKNRVEVLLQAVFHYLEQTP